MKNLNEPLKVENSEAIALPFKTPQLAPERPPLLPQQQVEDLRSQWTAIQTNFIDEPRQSVKDADALVASASKQISEAFASQRSLLEKQWGEGDQISTEELRLALQQYRSFFSRLLSI